MKIDAVEANLPSQSSSAEGIDRTESAYIQHNKIEIVAALKAAGISALTVEYRGEGDEGHHFEIRTEPEEVADLQGFVTLKVVNAIFVAGKWEASVVDQQFSLQDALEAFAEVLIDANGHSGYHDGDGGGGELVFDVDANTVAHEHYDTVIDRSVTYHDPI